MEQLYHAWLQSVSTLPVNLDHQHIGQAYKSFCDTFANEPIDKIKLEDFSHAVSGLLSALQQVREATEELLDNQTQQSLLELEKLVTEAEALMDNNTQNKEKKRKQHDPAAVATLTEWFDSHTTNPYPNSEEKQYLSSLTGMSISQIETWFSNTRRRKKN